MKVNSDSGERRPGPRYSPDRVVVFDTTLRDGAQTPGVGMNFWDRFVIAKALAHTGVDVIEAGFAANDADRPIIRAISRYVGSREDSPAICSLARLVPDDVRKAYSSIEEARPDKRRIHVFIGTSPDLMNHSHGKKKDRILEMIDECVPIARECVGSAGEVEYSSEDALRTDYDFLRETVRRAILAGADVINIPDTTGFAHPRRYAGTIRRLKKDVSEIDDLGVLLSAHVHNDSGLAVASTLEGMDAGIRQVEGTVMQLGERAGNADWMTVINDLEIMPDLDLDIAHINRGEFYKVASLVSSIIGHPLPLTHPVIGQAAFTESSGIHVKGVITDYRTYFITPPESVGRQGKIELGQTSGRNTVAWFLREHGYGHVGEKYQWGDLDAIIKRVKKNAIRVRGSLTDTEALLIAEQVINQVQRSRQVALIDYELRDAMKGSSVKAEFSYRRGSRKERLTGRGEGVGPVDAFMYALEDAFGMQPGFMELAHWDERAVYRGRGAPGFEILEEMDFSPEERKILGLEGDASKGQSARAKSYVELRLDGITYQGRAETPDIVGSTYKAITTAFDASCRINHRGMEP